MLEGVRRGLGDLGNRLRLHRPGAPAWGDELAFWDRYLRTNASALASPARRRNAFPAGLLEFVEPRRQEPRRKQAVLEIGSGPLSLLAWGVDQGMFDLTAIDPLADGYRRLMAAYGVNHPVVPVRGTGEKAARLFPENSFQLAYSSNAIDHAQSPRRCFEALARVVAPGGVIYCEGFVREGTNADWHGLHQHDLVPEDGQLVRYAREGTRTVLTEDLPLACLLERVEPLAERGLDSYGYEWEPGSNRDWRQDPWFTIVFRVSP